MSQLWRMTWVSEVCKTTRVLGMYRSHKDQAIPEEVQERYRRTGIVSYSQLLPKQCQRIPNVPNAALASCIGLEDGATASFCCT